jgi:predicted dehydrogenase
LVGVIGAGSFARQTLIPAFRDAGVRLKTIASAGGLSAVEAVRKFSFEAATTDYQRVIDDPEINTVVIATRHDTHARMVCDALRAGKHVFVEKPLALNDDQLAQITQTYNSGHGLILTVGFNRHFAPQAQRIKTLLTPMSQPKCFVLTVNAGAVASEHWVQSRHEGGGRIIGEACHFIELLRYLAGHSITSVQALSAGNASLGEIRDDQTSFTLGFADGSIGTVHYLGNGHRSFPKERLEVFCGGRVMQLDNFRRLTGYGWPAFRKMNLWRQDKGYANEIAAFVAAIRNVAEPPIPFDLLCEVTRVSFEVARQCVAGPSPA